MTTWFWLGFITLVFILIALDLRVARRRTRDVTPTAVAAWTAAWIALSIGFGGLLFILYDAQWGGLGLVAHGQEPPVPTRGADAFSAFLTAYILEIALSLDNVFVLTLLFDYLRMPRLHRHRVLFAGASIAIPIRAVMVVLGLTALEYAPWARFIFGVFIILAAVRMLTLRTDDPDPESNPATRIIRRLYPVTTGYEGGRFFTRLPDESRRGRRGRLAATPLLIALVLSESADAVYALGSIPAVLSIAKDPMLLISSNILALLTVRSMYSALARVIHRFTYVKASLVFVLLYAAALMFLYYHHPISPEISLSVIAGILCVGAGVSMIADRGTRAARLPEPPLGHEVAHYAGITVRQAKKLIVLVIGLSFVALSVPVGILLPGPGGIPMAILGLMILATEFVWARRLLKRAREKADQATAEAEKRFGLVTKLRRAAAWVARRFGYSLPPPPAPPRT